MSHTAKLTQARDRIKALAERNREQAQRMDDMHKHDAEMACRDKAHGLDLAVRVIEDLLQD